MGKPRNQKYMATSEMTNLESPHKLGSMCLESIGDIASDNGGRFELSYKKSDFWDKPPLQPLMQHQYANNNNNRRFSKPDLSPQQAQKELEAKYTIFVGNVTSDTTQEDLINVFSQFGIYFNYTDFLMLTCQRPNKNSLDEEE